MSSEEACLLINENLELKKMNEWYTKQLSLYGVILTDWLQWTINITVLLQFYECANLPTALEGTSYILSDMVLSLLCFKL